MHREGNAEGREEDSSPRDRTKARRGMIEKAGERCWKLNHWWDKEEKRKKNGKRNRGKKKKEASPLARNCDYLVNKGVF